MSSAAKKKKREKKAKASLTTLEAEIERFLRLSPRHFLHMLAVLVVNMQLFILSHETVKGHGDGLRLGGRHCFHPVLAVHAPPKKNQMNKAFFFLTA